MPVVHLFVLINTMLIGIVPDIFVAHHQNFIRDLRQSSNFEFYFAGHYRLFQLISSKKADCDPKRTLKYELMKDMKYALEILCMADNIWYI